MKSKVKMMKAKFKWWKQSSSDPC